MREEEYWASQSPHIGPMTERCVVCGSPRGGVCEFDGLFYCTEHIPLDGFGTVFLY